MRARQDGSRLARPRGSHRRLDPGSESAESRNRTDSSKCFPAGRTDRLYRADSDENVDSATHSSTHGPVQFAVPVAAGAKAGRSRAGEKSGNCRCSRGLSAEPTRKAESCRDRPSTGDKRSTEKSESLDEPDAAFRVSIVCIATTMQVPVQQSCSAIISRPEP